MLVGTSVNDREEPCFCLEGFCERSTNVSVEGPERGPEFETVFKEEACFFFLRCFSPLDGGMSSSSDKRRM